MFGDVNLVRVAMILGWVPDVASDGTIRAIEMSDVLVPADGDIFGSKEEPLSRTTGSVRIAPTSDGGVVSVKVDGSNIRPPATDVSGEGVFDLVMGYGKSKLFDEAASYT